MNRDLDPTELAHRSANARGHERDRRGHGAATDPESIAAFVRATAKRRAATAATAVVVTREPRGYTAAEHERADALRGEAASLRRMAEAKPYGDQRRLVEGEAANLERDAEAIVPLEHARAGWR